MTEILIVDDEPLVLLTVKSLCSWEGRGIRIAGEAQNGKAALEFLQNNPSVDIVITDVDMPVMDGLELSERMREGGYEQAVIFLSSYSNFEYVRRAFKAGACDYILKSELDEGRLTSLIRKVTDRKNEETHPDAAGAADFALLEGLRDSFFRDMAEGPVPLLAERFASCRFNAAFPFHFMILRPGDMPVVRKRYESNLYAFQKTVADLLSHFAGGADGDCGALSFDQYWVFMQDPGKMEKAFDRFYEASWSYLDIGFERRTGGVIARVEDLPELFVSCMRGFVPPSRIVVRTRRYIREHYHESGMDLSRIAEYTEVSKNHLSWEFARETGETVTDFITRTRMDEAKKLLLETNLRTYEIAEKAGYANVETFCRAFKKATGTSPRQFS